MDQTAGFAAGSWIVRQPPRKVYEDLIPFSYLLRPYIVTFAVA
jgi:hypothetical protein